MYPSNLIDLETARDAIDVFGGYNHNLRINDGEWYDMKNLTSSYYPVLSPRDKRGEWEYPVNPLQDDTHQPLCMIAKDSLFYIDMVGTAGNEPVAKLFKNNVEVTLATGVTLSNQEPKQMISMGAFVVIFPDKIWFNSLDEAVDSQTGERQSGYIDREYTSAQGNNVTFSLCNSADGGAFSESIESNSVEPSDTSNIWLDTSSTPHVLKKYSSSAAMWVPIGSTYIKIKAPGIATGFEIGDGVTISGITAENIALESGLNDINSTSTSKKPMIIQGKGVEENTEYIVVIGLLGRQLSQTDPITVSRKMPDLDFVTESKNRLWGCRYGTQNGAVVNEIYCSKLGDFKNWNSFAGISTDSWVASCGTDGAWTGAVTHNGYPIFFKENHMHKVYGDYPSEYRIQDVACRGVEKGSSKSLAIVNEVLYYKSRNGICAYDGSLPVEISAAFGEEKYSAAVAGDLDNKYYVSMKDDNNQYHLFVYDTRKDMWHREDNTHANEFCRCRNDLYFIDGDKIKTVKGIEKVTEGTVEWYAESGIIGMNMLDKKFVSRLLVRMSLALGSVVRFFIQYDSTGGYEPVGTMTGRSLRTFTVPIRPKRCDHFRLKIVGKGEAKIYSISKTIEHGSDLQ